MYAARASLNDVHISLCDDFKEVSIALLLPTDTQLSAEIVCVCVFVKDVLKDSISFSCIILHPQLSICKELGIFSYC